MNGRRHELTRPEPPVLVGESAREAPAFRLHVMRSIRMRPVLAGSVAAVVFVLLIAYALARKPTYTAESLIYVEPLEVRVLTDGSSSGYDPSRYDSYLQQQVQTVERADTLEAAVAKIPAGVWGPPGEPIAAAARRLLSSLKVDRVLNSYELGIDVTASSPTAAAAAANAVASAYLEQGRKDEHARADQRLQLLTEERQRITDDMSEDKAEQATLGKTLGVANPNGVSGNPYDLQSEGLRSQLAAAREAHDAVAAQLASVAGQNGNGLETAANEMILTDAGLVSQRQTLSQRRAVLSDQMAGLTPANPVYRQDQEEISHIDAAIERATDEARQRAERQLQDKLRLDLGRTADVEGRLNAQLAQQTAKATGAGPKLQRAAELETDLQRLSTRFATVDDAIRGLQLETGGPGQSHLAMAARVPDSAQPSRSKLILLLALPLALLFGAGAAVVARKRDPRLYLAGDMQEVLGFPPMCVLPSASEVSPEAYDEFVLRLAGGLEGAYRHGGARSFVFTPVSVGGRAVAMLPQLCKKLRQIGYRAVVVGADELMPGTAKTMESGSHEIGPVRAREGFATTKLERLLEEYDLVLVVAPPLLGSAVAEYTVRSADATILLVESARTNRGELRRAAMLLERLNPQGIGAVLEDLPLHYADPVFRAAVQAADSWPVIPVKRAAEKARTSSSAGQKAAVHKPPAPEIKLPVTAPSLPVEEEAAEEEAEAPEPPYVEQKTEELVETPAPTVAAPEAREQKPASRLEHAQLFPIYQAPGAQAPIEQPSVEQASIEQAPVGRGYSAPAERVPVPTPVVAAVQSPAVSLLDEEPVSIPTEFKPVRFHDASGPAPRTEIKYFTEKPLAGSEREPIRPAVQEAVQRASGPLMDERAETVDTWGWTSSRGDLVHAEVVEEPIGELASEPPIKTDFARVTEPAIDSSFEPGFEPAVKPVVEPVREALESPAEVRREEEVVAEPITAESLPILASSEAEAAKETKPLSWFKRVFGAADEAPLHVTPEPEELLRREPASASAAAEFVHAPVEDAEAVGVAMDSREEGAETARHQGAESAEPAEFVELADHSFRKEDEVASEEDVRAEPPTPFEESLWVRGTRALEASGQPRVQFFLDLSSQPVAEHSAEVQEEAAAPAAHVQHAAEVHSAPGTAVHGDVASASDVAHELVAEQEKLGASADTGVRAEVVEADPILALVDEPIAELVREQEVTPVPAVEALASHEESFIGGETAALQDAAAEAAHAVHPRDEGETLRVEKPAGEENKRAAFPPFAPSIAPISSGQFPLRTLDRTDGQRAGLARAMRQAGIEDKLPVRSVPVSSRDEHAPLRTGSGLRKAAVRQEAVLRSHVLPAEPLRGQAGMSRRWGMLSRFERTGPASETSDLAGTAPKNGTDSSQ